MLNMEEAVKAICGENPGIKIMVGGAPLTRRSPGKWGPTALSRTLTWRRKKPRSCSARGG